MFRKIWNYFAHDTKIHIPKGFVSRLKEENEYTPDAWKLEGFDTQLVFVYDEFARKHSHHKYISDASVYLAEAYTDDPFTLWKFKLEEGKVAVALREPKFTSIERWETPRKGYAAKIRGELHAIRPYKMRVMDKYKLNGLAFKRERISVTIPYRERFFTPKNRWQTSEPKEYQVEAWMYIGLRRQWDSMEYSRFEPVSLFMPNNPARAPYYNFIPKEDNV